MFAVCIHQPVHLNLQGITASVLQSDFLFPCIIVWQNKWSCSRKSNLWEPKIKHRVGDTETRGSQLDFLRTGIFTPHHAASPVHLDIHVYVCSLNIKFKDKTIGLQLKVTVNA